MPRLLSCVALLALAAAAPAQGDAAAAFRAAFVPLVANHCASCHGADVPEADLDLVAFAKTPPPASAAAVVRRIRDRLAAGEMPPPGEPRPDDAASRGVILAADRFLAALDAAAGPIDPGRVTMRRLSRYEYTNTVRDLLQVETDVAQTFPADDLGYGFDNIGDALSFSLLHLEKLVAAAERIAAQAIVTEDPAHPPARRFEAEALELEGHGRQDGDVAGFYSRGQVSAVVTLPRDGHYLLRARAFGDQAGDEPARLEIAVDGRALAAIDVPERRSSPAVKELRATLPGGARTVALAFANDFWQPDHPDPSKRDRNLYVDWLEVVGPVDPPAIPPSHRIVFAADPGQGRPEQRARPILAELARRAFRRPVTEAEVGRLAGLVAAAVNGGDRFEEAMQLGLAAILVSPHFLFRAEPGAHRGPEGRALDLEPFALASRLSYFLWSSMPDEALFARAASGALEDPAALEAEARRMLDDPRARALSESFAAQWLELRSLEQVAPDPMRFPEFGPALRTAMAEESRRFFDAVLREDRPLAELLAADFTFADETLARHYGLELPPGEGFRRVALPPARRGGILFHASVLTVTSNPDRTSPVKRGKWVLENVLDAPPPPPPPGADSLKDADRITSAASLREQMRLHREKASCAVCHERMDALGLALENFDAIGRWRDEDAGAPIDATAALPDGRRLAGPEDLRRLLAGDPAFLRCLARKLFVYAVGRDLGADDERALGALAASLAGARTTLEDLIVGIVRLDAFRRRRAVR